MYRYIITGVTQNQEHSGDAEGQPADSIDVKFGLVRLDCADEHIAAKSSSNSSDDYPMPEPRHGETHNQIRNPKF